MRHDPHFHRNLHVVTPLRRARARFLTVPIMATAAALALIASAWPDRATINDPSPGGTRFALCPIGGGADCVVDGDTFWMAGQKIRIADIDTPETHPPRCDEEAALGDRATLRLQALLNAGPIKLRDADRAYDRFGRRLAIVTRNGRSLGDTLVAEGLARPWEGRRRPWCA